MPLWRGLMPPIAPHLPAFFRERLPLQRGASAPTGASDASTLQLLLASVSQRLPLQPSALCLEPLEAPMGMDFLAYLAAERGNSPRTRHTR